MKKLAIIGGGIMASNYGAACRRAGCESHYFSLPDGKVNDSDVDFYHNVNILENDRITEMCRDIGIDGVVSTTELSVPVTAYIADKLNLLGNPVDVAIGITDKFRNRECIKGLTTIKSPQYRTVSSLDELRNTNIPYPIILKPASLGGKRGLSVVRNDIELEDAFLYATRAYSERQSKPIIIEQFLEEGIECSVESLTYKGKHTIIQITQKESSGAPHCVELAHHQPAALSEGLWNKVISAVSDGLSAIGLTNGPCHTEIKIVGDDIYLIEFNARPGGDHIWDEMIELSTGFDIMAAIVKAALGELPPIDTKSFYHRYSGMYYVVNQTKYLKHTFDTCDEKDWLHKKHFVTNDLRELKQNDLDNTNYFIYSSDTGNPIKDLL